MLFCVLAKCSSLREVSGAMLGLSGKTKHFGLEHLPFRSTLSDANKRRDANVFSHIYHQLLYQYKHFISDSRFKEVINKQNFPLKYFLGDNENAIKIQIY
jgi:hypothetical protein